MHLFLLLPALASAAAYPAQPGGMSKPFVYPDEQQFDLGPPPASPAGISFSGVFTDHTVLQRGAKSMAAVYGAVVIGINPIATLEKQLLNMIGNLV
jgi:hypothetical protein